MKKTFLGIIPSRFGSTRFPGKPLADIHGKPMIQHVYERARECRELSEVIVATDDERIERAVLEFGGTVCMTSPRHPSGTDRCAEVVQKLTPACDAVINIQGDEPFISPEQISLLCSCFADDRTQLATLIKKIDSAEVLFNANAPKVVVDGNGFAIYFSRHPIPYLRGIEQNNWLNNHAFYQHVGIYGYRTDVLKEIPKLSPSKLETAESLEQLRWIENGLRIKTAVTTIETISVDTPQDLKRIQSITPRS